MLGKTAGFGTKTTDAIVDALQKYQFTDEYGHDLEFCQDFQALVTIAKMGEDCLRSELHDIGQKLSGQDCDRDWGEFRENLIIRSVHLGNALDYQVASMVELSE